MDSTLTPEHVTAESLPAADYVRMLQQLLQAISKHAVGAKSAQLNAFQEKVDAVAQNLTEFANASAFAPGIDTVIQALEEHHREINLALKAGAEHNLAAVAPPDETTGLPARATAEQNLTRRLAESKEEFAVALYIVDRVPTINARFGRAMGDKVLNTVSGHLQQKINKPGALMRWSGPGFITILDVNDNWNQMERDAKRVASFRLQFEMNSAGRSTMLPLTCTLVLHKVQPGDSSENLFRALDSLVAENNGVMVNAS